MKLWERILGRCKGCEARDAEIDRLMATQAEQAATVRQAMAFLSAQADLRAHLAAERKPGPPEAKEQPPRPRVAKMPMASAHLATRGHMPAREWRGGPTRRPQPPRSDVE